MHVVYNERTQWKKSILESCEEIANKYIELAKLYEFSMCKQLRNFVNL